ncbi:hypothetical protein SAMN05444397_10689 [Flavobacterium aquidurense]|uniref:TonB-dependent Receptor Plug Domain n=1 Tax=Flavobacterium frigidimaris TaxID=262320 RepID=A0ABX4BRM0_FLAFR|nr:hypothetical protein [Flavobacterium frigidimaris]OXA79870.1 hypothetical protein B0A65_07935 [Flavobacterium frigidimaris]SDZ39418.1 hypothetical protein SAMN05444397_10689 [Flavobacterium aquidurense]
MDRLKYILVITFIVSFQQISFAQKNNSITELNDIDKKLNESIYVSTNGNSFLTGETLLYKFFCVNNATNIPSKYTKVAYLKLIDSNKKTVFTHKLFLDNGVANGDFFIPTTLETGSYKIVGYTSWMLNKNASAYFNLDVFIFNPYKEKSNNVISQKTLQSEVVTNENISFDLKNKIFKSRDKIEFKINTSSDEFAKGNYVVSVRKTDGFLSQKKKNFKEVLDENLTGKLNTEISGINATLPELRGEIISGKLSSNTLEIKNKKVALSIVGKKNDLKITKTDDQGIFLFNLEEPNPNSNIIVQVIEDNKEEYTLTIDQLKDIDVSGLTFPTVEFNSDFVNNVTERLVATQIENAYYTKKKDSTIVPINSTPFYGTLSKEFKLDAFTRFPTMAETITEVVAGVYFKKENNNYSIHVYDYDPNYESSIPALIIVDGLFIENVNELFTYNPKNIDKVNVVKGLYYYGSKSFNGIVDFTTKNGDFDTNLKGNFIIRPELLRPQYKKEYFQPDYANNKDSRIPDYRHQLLWLPKVDLANSDSKITFYASDVSGKYEIILEGFSANGKPVFIKENIEIQDLISN